MSGVRALGLAPSECVALGAAAVVVAWVWLDSSSSLRVCARARDCVVDSVSLR
jgi:hypothetical protein